MTQAAAKSWYVLHVRAGTEFKVGVELRKAGHTYLIPSVRKKVRHETAAGGKTKHERKVPIFARYVFFAFAGDNAKWDDVQAIEPKPCKPISFDGQPAKLSTADVEYLSTMKAPPKQEDAGKIKVGILAKIIEGPFAGFGAKVDKVERAEGEEQASMQVYIMGRPTPIRIPVRQLQAA